MVKIFIRIIIVFVFVQISLCSHAQVNLQTGAPQINIPLYGIADANSGLSTSVSLNYVGGNGIKVDGIASNVGTGWELTFGGSITRITRGEPDDQKQSNSYNPLSTNTPTQQQLLDHQFYVNNYYPNGFLYSEYDQTLSVTNRGAYNYLRSGLYKDLPDPKFLTDREMDVFSFNFNGRSGTFSIAKTVNRKEAFTYGLKDSKLKILIEHDENLINSNPSIRTTIKRITITDETGIQFVFEDMELTEVIKYEKKEIYNNGSLDTGPTNSMTYTYTPTTVQSAATNAPGVCSSSSFPVMKGIRTGQYVCNKWMLTKIINPLTNKIINPLTNKTINYTYDNITILIDGTHSAVRSSTSNNCSFAVKIDALSQITKRIKTIGNQFGDKIEFDYGFNREDLQGDQVLENISFFNKGIYISRTAFQYGYFFKQLIKNANDNFLSSDKPFLRLCLNQIQKTGLNNAKEPPYKFEYTLKTNTNVSVYPPGFSFFKDHWGYFNGGGNYPAGYSNYYIPEVGKPYSKEFYTASFGGYGLRDLNNNSLFAANGLLTKITFPLGENQQFEYEQNTCLYQGGNLSVGGVRVKKVTLDDANSLQKREVVYKYVLDNSSNSSGWGYEPPIYDQNVPVTVYRCGNDNIYSPLYSIGQTAVGSIQVTHAGEALKIGVDPASIAVSLAFQIIIPILTDIFSSDYHDFINTITYSDPINFNNPLPFLYSRVEVKNITNSIQSGTDIYEFTSPSEYSLEVPNLLLPFSYKQRYGYWKYGLTKKLTNKDVSGNLVKIVENKYDPVPYQIELTGDNAYLSRKWKASSIITGCFPIYYDQGFSDRIINETYKPFVGKIDLLETKEYLYNKAGNYTLKTTLFEYNADYLLSLKTQYNSEGEKIETFYKYVNDYSVTGPITTLKAKNNISAPVLTETYIYKSEIKKLLSGSIIEYETLPNGNILPVKTYGLRTDRPVNDNSVAAFSSAQLVRDPNYYKPTRQLIYDVNGNLVQTNKLFNNETIIPEKASVIVDKSNPQLVIATATNSAYTDLAYTSFETPVAANNWSYNESLVFKDDWLTGEASLKLDNIVRSISRLNLNAGVKYKISFWAKNVAAGNFIPLVNKNNERTNGYLVNNITPTKVYTNPVSQWSLYECSVPVGATSVYIHNQDPANPANGVPVFIDEVRLYPEGAAMTTTTYNIQGLKTSVTDANNKIQFMEYDGLGRLRLIRDEERSILKTYEYNFKQ